MLRASEDASPAAGRTNERPSEIPRTVRRTAAEGGHTGHIKASLGTLALGALGVVFGDIGTSPLYAMKECVDPDHGVPPTHDNVLGILSLVVWSLVMVVAVKYLTFIMRADNEGEGGILALLALVPKEKRDKGNPMRIGWLAGLVLFGAALLYGDGVITPAISVLSAVEGLEVATPKLATFVLPLTCVILAGLFAVQRKGTAGIGAVFGPIMGIWFVTLAALGIPSILHYPAVLTAVNPQHAVEFFRHHGVYGFMVLGAVVLVITGGEALYADMGHFGRRPIRIAWFALVMPSLLVNYFGQGAAMILHPEAASNPFYGLVPSALIYPMVVLSTIATIIASQALISGSYSLTRQAIQLGFFPRVTIVHTSGEAEGQIYIPEVNAGLALACLALVLAFKESSALAAAYGIAVTGTMAITSIVYFVVLTSTWHWPVWRALPIVALFLMFDIPFFGANLLKFTHGGWFPIAVATAIFAIMTTWKTGRALLARHIAERMLPTQAFLGDVAEHKPHRVPGTAVFMSSNPNGIPIVLLHHWKHNQVLHETVVLLSVVSANVPDVPAAQRVKVSDLGHGFYQVSASFGFMQTPNVPHVLQEAATRFGMPYVPERTSYFLGRETLLSSGRSQMWRWRKRLFSFVSRNATSATRYFCIPPDRVVELGMQIDL